MEFYPEGMNAELDRQFTTPEALRRAMMQGSILESRVLLCDREHNLHVDLGAMRGIIPREEGAVGIDDGTVRDIFKEFHIEKNALASGCVFRF